MKSVLHAEISRPVRSNCETRGWAEQPADVPCSPVQPWGGQPGHWPSSMRAGVVLGRGLLVGLWEGGFPLQPQGQQARSYPAWCHSICSCFLYKYLTSFLIPAVLFVPVVVRQGVMSNVGKYRFYWFINITPQFICLNFIFQMLHGSSVFLKFHLQFYIPVLYLLK